MRHGCKECGASYRNPHDLDEHKRVGCHAHSSGGPTWLAEDTDEEGLVEEVEQKISPEPEPQEKESSQWQEPTST
jgi:hypothetical protein